MPVKGLLAATPIATMTFGGSACAVGVVRMAVALAQWAARAAAGTSLLVVPPGHLGP